MRELADLAGQLTGAAPQICVFAGECFGAYLTVEPTGEVSACDKYIDDGTYRFGNVLGTGLTGARLSEQLARVRRGEHGAPWTGCGLAGGSRSATEAAPTTATPGSGDSQATTVVVAGSRHCSTTWR